MGTDHRNPALTTDLIIRDRQGRVVLIERKFPPPGWALPGGFVDYGESLEQAAVREALEETSLEVRLERQFHTYSDPDRDPRQHAVTTVFLATVAGGTLRAADDAAVAAFFTREQVEAMALAFDHRAILDDYFNRRH